MYLSTRQHDQLQIIVTGFEIPFRTYIATEILKRYPTESSFITDVSNKTSLPINNSNYQVVNSELGKIKNDASRCYTLLKNVHQIKGTSIVINEINVPNVSTTIALTIIFKELFTSLLLQYKDESTYLDQAIKYKYVRNKLDHRGCKTLEDTDMIITLDFISNALLFLNDDSSLFWEKSCEDLLKELRALQSLENVIPIEINNISSMPFPDMKIVCRDREIEEIKEFIYGRPGALRKQVSMVLFGYGGVGKTALALEVVKQVIKDIQDNTTINGYRPDFILFFTAKEEALSFSSTTGKIQNIPTRFSFKTAEELINKIYSFLGITSFQDYAKKGLIIVDNLETLSAEEREKVSEFIRFSSPQQIQYIVTSRNEENYECRKKIAGFEDNVSGQEFVMSYLKENNLELELTDDEIVILLQISMGNTLVLVLCLRRLGLNLVTINGIVSDMSTPATITKLEKEMQQIPANGFNIISEYMFKNSFQEIQDNYKDNAVLLSSVLKIFAVYPSDAIDLYTISMLSKEPYCRLDPILELLCQYLIIEKVGDLYRLNQFAEKYIIQLFMPDSEVYEKISSEISNSTRRIQEELNDLQNDIEGSSVLKRIIQDWNVITDGDKISVAKAYKLYGDVNNECHRRNTRFFISSTFESSIKMIETLEQNTMHPYVKFQKARILQCINETGVLEENLISEISQAYNDTIWAIKTNPIYNSIKGTKSFASVLWKYGIHLSNCEKYSDAVRYLEEGKLVFEQINDKTDDYFQCICLLATNMLKIYAQNKDDYLQYLRKARQLSIILYENRDSLKRATKTNSINLKNELRKYGQF